MFDYSDFKEEHTIKDDEYWEHCPEVPGVYALIVRDKDNRPYSINRILGTDNTGLLYIGESQNLRNRLGDLKKSILERYASDSHPAGRQYKDNEKLKTKFPEETLKIRFKEIETHEEEEKRLLIAYRDEFGELPPFNQKI